MNKKKIQSRRTKCFSVSPSEIRLFEKLATDARRNGRTESGQLVLILENYFEQQEIIKKINKPGRHVTPETIAETELE